MKRIILLSSLTCTFFASAQQQIGNGSMEDWQNVGADTEEPTNWNSFKTASGSMAWAASKQIERSTSIRAGATGTYCARIWSKSVLGVIANGTMTIGQVNMGSSTATSSSNYNWSNTGDANFSEGLTDVPDSLVFWVKYTPINGSSQARVSAVLHDTYDYKDGYNVDAGSEPHKVAEVSYNYGTTSGQWVRKSIAWNYGGPASTHTYILITFATNNIPGGGDANDEVLIDDVELIYNPVGPVNEPIVASDDNVVTPFETSIEISVLTNDNDPESDINLSSLQVTVNPIGGTAVPNTSTGIITYTPNTGFWGDDYFTYSICDNGDPIPVTCDEAVVYVTVNEEVGLTENNIQLISHKLVGDNLSFVYPEATTGSVEIYTADGKLIGNGTLNQSFNVNGQEGVLIIKISTEKINQTIRILNN